MIVPFLKSNIYVYTCTLFLFLIIYRFWLTVLICSPILDSKHLVNTFYSKMYKLALKLFPKNKNKSLLVLGP